MTYALFRRLRQGPRLNSRLSSHHLSALNYDDWQTLAGQCTKRLFIKRLEYFEYSRTNTERINRARMKKRKIDHFFRSISGKHPVWCVLFRLLTDDRVGDGKNMEKLTLLLNVERPTPRYCLLLCRIFYMIATTVPSALWFSNSSAVFLNVGKVENISCPFQTITHNTLYIFQFS